MTCSPQHKRPIKPAQIKRSQGSALVLAIFIMLVLMLLGTALIRLLETSSESISYEVLGTRALAAAHSGMEAQLQVLFPLAPNAGVCQNNNISFTAIEGLKGCSAEVQCALYATHTDETVSYNYWRFTSTGECGAGSDVVVTRTIQVEARSL